MPKDNYGISGLATAPNPVVGAPPGALLRSENCVHRRSGSSEPRPGFKEGTDIAALETIWKLIPFDGDVLCFGADVDNFQKAYWAGNQSAMTPTNVWTQHQTRGVDTRGNLYLTASDAVRKASDARQAASDYVGLQPLYLVDEGSSTSGVLPLLASTYKAYRAVLKRTDASGVVTRSLPSGRVVFENDASARAPKLLIGWATSIGGSYLGFVRAGDVIELYVTPCALAEPPDEMLLAYSITVTAAHVSAGYIQQTDHRLDRDLADPLYTNSSQEGQAKANFAPPKAKDLDLFRGSLFASNIAWPHLMRLSWDAQNNQDRSGQATGIGYRTLTVTVTHNSANLTVASSTTGLQVGQILQAGSSWGAGTGPVVITAIVGATITVSDAYTGSTAALTSVTFWDAIKIVGASATQYFPSVSTAQLLLTLAYPQAASIFNTALRTLPSTEVVGWSEENASFNVIGGSMPDQPVSIDLLRRLPSEAAFSVAATHGDEFTPPVPLISSGLYTVSTQDSFANGLTWSKGDQPEHWLRRALWFVGNSAPICRIVHLLDALYIFKERGDGVYKLTGFSELNGWSVEEVASDIYPLHPELITVFNDQIYAWTNSGMARIDGSGVQVLSDPIKDLVIDAQELLDPGAATLPYAYAAANAPHGEVIFGMPDSATDRDTPPRAYVYSTARQAWSGWFMEGLFTPISAAANPATRALWLGCSENGTPLQSRLPSESYVLNADREYAITVTDVTAGVCTFTQTGAWLPRIGDLVRQGVNYCLITETDSASTFVADGVTAAAATAYEAYESITEWLPEQDPTGALVKSYLFSVLHFEDTYGLAAFTCDVSGSDTDDPELLDETIDYVRLSARKDLRVLFTPECSRNTQMSFTLRIRQADSRWRLGGVSHEYLIASRRVSL